jgi:hypothetical protein
MGETFKRGAAALALLVAGATGAEARHHARPTHCATATEVTAVAATSVQQELMVAALTCNQIPNFNAFQTNFGSELRASDRALMHMFTRLYGGAKGQSEYHGFKTRLANNSEMRSIHGNAEFCTATAQVFAAALASNKPSLGDFVSGVEVSDPGPVESCQMQVALGLQGTMAALNISPRQKPAEFQEISLAGPPQPPLSQPAPALGATAPLAASAQAQTPPATASVAAAVPPAGADSKASPEPKKKSGWLGFIFD